MTRSLPGYLSYVRKNFANWVKKSAKKYESTIQTLHSTPINSIIVVFIVSFPVQYQVKIEGYNSLKRKYTARKDELHM